MQRTAQRNLRHLYLRAGFGESPEFIQSHSEKSLDWHLNRLFTESGKVEDLRHLPDPTRGHEHEVGKFKMGVLFMRSKKELKELNLHWLERMATTATQVREKMTLFWHDHFATSVPVGYLMQVQNNTLRRHALGRFGDLLHAVAKDPAMLIYLNNQQNRKGHPNENFAREVMELFTLGIGNYTEQDIKEAARAFTGWQVSMTGQYTFNERQHDDGPKTVLGTSGRLTGEQVLDLLIAHPQTTQHLATKLYSAFVSPIPDAGHIQEIAGWLSESKLDIGATLRRLFLSDWFYYDEHLGALVKSPVELLVEYRRLLGMEMRQELMLLKLQKALGQVLFFPPNVAGWPNGTQWIDSSTLLLRMKLPLVALGADAFEITVKPDLEDEGPDISESEAPRQFRAEVDWKRFTGAFTEVTDADLPQTIVDALFTCPQDRVELSLLRDYADHSSRTDLIRSLTIRVLALPEFQLK